MHVSKPIMLAFAIVAATTSAVLADFLVGTTTLELTVPENIHFPRTFETILDPNDVFFWTVPITNTGQAESAIDLHFTTEPPTGKVQVESVEFLVIPATTTVDVDVAVKAANDIEPGPYKIHLDVKRSGG